MIGKLREIMKVDNVNITIIPMGDYHQSEYVCEHFKLVKFFSGFTGSAGTLVVSEREAALFTDGRYFIQAEREIDTDVVTLMRMGMEGVPTVIDYVADLCSSGDVVAFDGRVVDAGFGIKLAKEISKVGTIRYDFSPVEKLWADRPALPKDKVFILEEKYSGESLKSKVTRLRIAMEALDSQVHVLSSLDDIAWLLNIRGNDIMHNPVVLSYAVVTMEEIKLYSDKGKYDERLLEYFEKNNVILKDYEQFYEDIKQIKDEKVLFDDKHSNFFIYHTLMENNECIIRQNPTLKFKAVKNDTEIANLKSAHIKDGVAVTKFIIWLKSNIEKLNITEYDAAKYLGELRRQQEGFIEESFETICAYRENAAMMHYSCDEHSARPLKPAGMLLVDSGGQYFEGTTDVTRTFALGEVGDEEKKAFTLVLKGMLNLTHAKFLYGCTGVNLDILARGPLWDEFIDYRCGTGHGVSYLLGVHEGPNAFRWKRRDDDCVLEEGMVTSNEPGVYVENEYGIRTENEIVCVKSAKNEYGQFMGFETLTMVPIDTDLIDVRYLDKKDIERINEYNNVAICTLLPYFDEKERFWIEKNVKKLY